MTTKNYIAIVRIKNEEKAIFPEKITEKNGFVICQCRNKEGQAYERKIAMSEVAEISRDIKENATGEPNTASEPSDEDTEE